ncbi:unnamed protein product [Hydatigera taeniaeformis]|uniref:Uncharacterized protein n=1 Tax=Hydatigena taeniaeformis TaxID=6205 RepID=A0A0R3WYD3_HYDTA|nr:unnamed protein product [Hydatigera taeniaeformis]
MPQHPSLLPYSRNCVNTSCMILATDAGIEHDDTVSWLMMAMEVYVVSLRHALEVSTVSTDFAPVLHMVSGTAIV